MRKVYRTKTAFERYLSAIYFGLTVLLTIGFGNIYAKTQVEMLIAIIWMLFGIIVYTYIISSLARSFAKVKNQTQSLQEEMDLFFREWTKMFKVPHETLEMILNTISMKNQSQSTRMMHALSLASEALADLPKGLSSEMYNSFLQDVLDKVMFFRNKPKQFLVMIVPLLKPTNFTRGDYIYKENDPAMEVFFVVKGRVISKCLDKYHKERAHILVEGGFFGEIDIILKRNRIGSVRAESNCELWKISKQDFLKTLEVFPIIREEVEELVSIKEAYRRPISMKTDPIAENPSRKYSDDSEEYGIFNALTKKMIKRIKKGNYHISTNDENIYESLDFEPDLPSPESEPVDNNNPVLSETEWKNFERSMTRRLIRSRDKKKKQTATDTFNLATAGSLGNQFNYVNSGLKKRILKHRECRESLRKSIFKKSESPVRLFDLDTTAKQMLVEKLKGEGVLIEDVSEITDVINAKEELDETRKKTTENIEKVEYDFDQMLSDAESMLVALEQLGLCLGDMGEIVDL